MVDSFFYLVFRGISLAAFVIALYALVEAIRIRPDAFLAAGKQTKKLWLIVLGAASFLSLGAFFVGYMFLGILSLIAGVVFLVDVRPAIRNLRGPGGW